MVFWYGLFFGSLAKSGGMCYNKSANAGKPLKGCLKKMKDMYRKVTQYLKILGDRRVRSEETIGSVMTCPCDYKKGHTPPPLSEFVPLGEDGAWGSGADSHAWFYFTLPEVGKHAFLRVETDKKGWDATNPQFMVYIDGELRQGADTNHREIALEAGAPREVFLYGYTGPRVERTCLFVSCGEWDPDVYDLYYDILYPFRMLDYLDPESGEYAEILEYLWHAVSMLDLIDETHFSETVREAKKFLAEEFYGKYCGERRAGVVCIGHTHIDCAWRWTLRQTREKVQRSFATVLELMKRYPEYQFMSSQPLLYSFMKEEAPEKYREIVERVKEGRWEAEGAMWVEPDCNLPSGESLVRQLLYGKGFFKREFGVESHILWLPDVFGYSAALPQILRKSGVDWFVTSKISWNDTNRMPNDTFLWKGIDGTEINSYFLTAQNDTGNPSERYTTYVGMLTAPMISGTYKRYSQKYLNNEALLTYGYGDGGGGPTTEHLELLRRGSCGVPGCPTAKIGFAEDFLERLGEKIRDNPQLPVWQGELYLEFHRGTYTTQAKNKRNNRKAEFLYQNAELLSVLGKQFLGTPIRADDLHRGWETILTNQFHDIIPGSSIRSVYEQCDRDYEEVFSIGNGIREEAENALSEAVEAKKGYLVFNHTSFETEGLVRVDGKTVLTKEKIAPMGYAVTDRFVGENHVKINGNCVETDLFRVTFDPAWQIVSLYDKENEREVLQKGKAGNELRVYADYPDKYDAWEWEAYSRDEWKALTAVTSAEVVEDGARRGIRVVRPHGKSTVTQTVWFYDSIRRIDFETEADWHEKHQMMKAAFPVDINTDRATYEIQFGNLQRPTHFNTSWDAAKFEVCAHKYADYSDGGYGVGMINDCKYGHDFHNGLMQLSLLRSPTDPDPDADQGMMKCTYAICPHKGDFAESDLIREAYLLNNPMRAIRATGKKTTLPSVLSVAKTDAENVICETVKPAENGEGTVLRFYESKNRRTVVTVRLGIPAEKVVLCDLMENEQSVIPVQNGAFRLEFRGYEIHTVKVL